MIDPSLNNLIFKPQILKFQPYIFLELCKKGMLFDDTFSTEIGLDLVGIAGPVR